MTLLEIILLTTSIVFIGMWIIEKKMKKFCWKQWNYFEIKYDSLYKAYIKKLSPEELARVQDMCINKEKDSWDLEPRLKKPLD